MIDVGRHASEAEPDERVEHRPDAAAAVEAAGAAFARAVSHAAYAQGHVSFPREIVLAQDRIEEAVMWALRALAKR